MMSQVISRGIGARTGRRSLPSQKMGNEVVGLEFEVLMQAGTGVGATAQFGAEFAEAEVDLLPLRAVVKSM
jgi:hypothetical protein